MKKLLLLLLLAVLAASLLWWSADRNTDAHPLSTGQAPQAEQAASASPAEAGLADPPRTALPSNPPPAASADCPERFIARFVRDEDGGPVTPGLLCALSGVNLTGEFHPGTTWARLDADGRGEVCLSKLTQDGPEHCVLHAPGRSPLIFRPQGNAAPQVRVARCASLSVRLTGRLAQDPAELLVRVDCPTTALWPRELGTPVRLVGFMRWTDEADAGGLAELAELPSNATLQLTVLHQERKVYAQAEKLILAPGEKRELEIVLDAGAKISVLVLDEQHLPIADQRVGLTHDVPDDAQDAECALFTAVRVPSFEQEALTDGEGRCTLSGVRPGTWWVGLPPRRAPWNPIDLEATTPVARKLVIAAGDAQREVTLLTSRGLYIQGRIEVPDGRLFPPESTSPSVILIAHATRLGGGLTGQPERDGSFALGPLTDEVYRIETFSSRYAPIEPIRASAQGGPLVIRLQLGARIAGRALDLVSGQGLACDVVLTRVDGTQPEVLGSSGSDGGYAFAGLSAGEYVVSAFAPGGRAGTSARRRVSTGQELTDVDPLIETAAACGQLRVVLEGAVESGRVTLWQDGVCVGFVFVDGPAVLVLAAPAGEVEARLSIGEACVERRTLALSAGATSELRWRR